MKAISPGKYLSIFFITTFATLLLISGLAIKVLFFESVFGHQKLYEYQLDKLSSNSDVETIFVGDSSLRNAIDADESLYHELLG